MTSEPGILPRDYEELDSNKLPTELSIALSQIKAHLLKEESQEDKDGNNLSVTSENGNGAPDQAILDDKSKIFVISISHR
jgi:hypothetical protein